MSKNTAYRIVKEINGLNKAIKALDRTGLRYQALNNRIEHLFDKVEDTDLFYIDYENGRYTIKEC